MESECYKRRGRETEYADIEHYTFKHARKVGYVKCPIEYKFNLGTKQQKDGFIIVEDHKKM